MITLIGEHFLNPMKVYFLTGSVIVGEGYIPLPEFSIRENRAFVGTPSLPEGSYGIRLETIGGVSPDYPDAIRFERFSDESKVEIVKKNIDAVWKMGRRLFSSGRAL